MIKGCKDVSDSSEVTSDKSTVHKDRKRHYFNEMPKNTAMTGERSGGYSRCYVQQCYSFNSRSTSTS